MLPPRRFTCPSCGGVIEERTEIAPIDGDHTHTHLAAETTIRHLGPRDAACQWVLEAYADETAAHLQRLFTDAADRLRP